VPVVSLSSYMYGGCPCESGLPIHACGGETDNVELAAMAAPRPQLVISDGHDWTDHMPEHDFPYLQKMYSYYGATANVGNVHLPNDKHDYKLSKRRPMYGFMAKHLGLNLNASDESRCTVEPDSALYVFGAHGERLPSDAIMGFVNLEKLWGSMHVGFQRYKVAVVDLMLIKRQKIGAFPLAKSVGADGVEVDMGGLGDRESFDNALAVDSVRRGFLDTARGLGLEICSLGMTGFYSQSFAARPTWQRMVSDCITTMKKMSVHMAFLPLGVNADPGQHPELRDLVVARLRVAGKMAEEAGVVIGIETTLPAVDEVKLLDAIGSPGVRSYFNFANAIDAHRDLCSELRILGKDRICQIHCTNTDGSGYRMTRLLI
jgi:sugar phosphate isomerase/epimerase